MSIEACGFLLLNRFRNSLTSAGIPRKLSAIHTFRSGRGVDGECIWQLAENERKFKRVPVTRQLQGSAFEMSAKAGP